MKPILVFSFLAGVGSFFSPCSVALIPAYLSYTIQSEAKGHASAKTKAAISFGLLASGGLLLVYGVFGLAALLLRALVAQILFYVALGTGLLLMVLGILMFAGKVKGLSVHHLVRPGRRGFFVFGVAYALGSLGCTLPLFLFVILTSLQARDYAGVLLNFGAFSLAMVMLLLTFTALSLLAREALARFLTRCMGLILRVSALVITVAGLYVIYFQLHSRTVIRF